MYLVKKATTAKFIKGARNSGMPLYREVFKKIKV